ncbi:dTMP kinase [Deinococcus lacus]|uniref:Thymidylate kinase n=1 Tax=Deinococcus lacus TaxID=392561 RepID=A0ABW1YAC6_9DEIO
MRGWPPTWKAGASPLVTKEPGGTPAGEGIRALLLDPDLDIEPVAEVLLYSASRAQLVSAVLRPALQRGETVLCDRYTDSTLAYQGYGRGLPLEWLREMTKAATGGLTPDLTVLLDLDPALGLQRAARRSAADRLEAESLDFHNRVRAGFLNLAAQQPQRWLVLDAAQDEAALAGQIWERVSHLLERPAGPPT